MEPNAVRPTKIDLKRAVPYRARQGHIDLVDVPRTHYLMVDGAGNPNAAPRYRQALETLYPTAYALKFFSKRELGRDATVMPLEALWWADDPASFTSARNKDLWQWTTMIAVPDWCTEAHIDAARATAVQKGAPLADELRWEVLHEGRCAQTLHLGSYDDEGPVLAELHDRFLPGNGLRPRGHHHEIYLSDARRTAPERLRTILRQPVETIP